MATPTIVHSGPCASAAVTLDWVGVSHPQDAAVEQGSLLDWVCQALDTLRKPSSRSRITETTPGVLRDGADWRREFSDRLRSVRELPDNWDGEDVSRVDRAILDTARDLVPRLEPDRSADMQVPQVVPDATGRLHLLWWRGNDYFAIALVNEHEAVCLTKQGDEFTQYYCLVNDLRNIRNRLRAFINSNP